MRRGERCVLAPQSRDVRIDCHSLAHTHTNAHAVVIGALLSALARLIHRRCRQMRLAAGPACIRRVSARAHTIPHTTAHMGTCSGAHTCARLPQVYMRNVAYAHSTSLTRSRSDTLVRTCAHAHAHSQTDRFTHTDGISQEGVENTKLSTNKQHTLSKDTPRHTHAHTCNTRTHTQLPTYTHTHMNNRRHTKEHALIQTHTQTHTRTHAQLQMHRERERRDIA